MFISLYSTLFAWHGEPIRAHYRTLPKFPFGEVNSHKLLLLGWDSFEVFFSYSEVCECEVYTALQSFTGNGSTAVLL